jgi:hypothetical protein
MRNQTQPGLPAPQGLYDPRFEHDACGVSFVASLKGEVSRSIVMMGLGALCNMEHRGATGAEADTGDGAGILIQVPDRFLRGVAGFELPRAGAYAVGLAFLPADPTDAEKAQEAIATIVADEGLTVLGSLIHLASWEAQRHRIDPLGSDKYISTESQSLVFPNIAGHRDIGSTLCPGTRMEGGLPWLRKQVANRVGSFPARVADMRKLAWVLSTK